MRPIYSHLERTSLVNKEFIIWPRKKISLATNAGNPERATWVGLYFELCYLNIFSLINIVNKKRICDRSLHFQSQMTKAPRIVQWISVSNKLDLTTFRGDNVAAFAGRLCSRRNRFGPCYRHEVLLLWPQPHLRFLKYFSIFTCSIWNPGIY